MICCTPIMKLGIVCYPTYGGSGVMATELGLAMAGKGFEVHFISYKRPVRLGGFYPNVYYHEVNSFEYPLFDFKPYDTALASKIVNICLHYQLDLLHVHYAIPHATIAHLAKEILYTKGIKLPIITTLHGTDITLVGNESSFHPVVEFSINQSDGVTAVSESLKQDTLKHFQIEKPIEVIYNFIDFSRFKKRHQLFKSQFGCENQKLILHVSNFRKVKRISDILKVFKGIHSEIKSKLVLIGDGPESTSLVDLTEELGLKDSVIFMGKQDAIEEMLDLADLFILASEHESFGLAALEAMACEVPVISTDAGGLKEVNLHGYSGYVSAVGDIESMTKNALSILTDDTILNQFKKQALQQAKKFDLDVILPQYINYYQCIIDASQQKK